MLTVSCWSRTCLIYNLRTWKKCLAYNLATFSKLGDRHVSIFKKFLSKDLRSYNILPFFFPVYFLVPTGLKAMVILSSWQRMNLPECFGSFPWELSGIRIFSLTRDRCKTLGEVTQSPKINLISCWGLCNQVTFCRNEMHSINVFLKGHFKNYGILKISRFALTESPLYAEVNFILTESSCACKSI